MAKITRADEKLSKDFVQFSRELAQDSSVRSDTKGVLLYLLSLPPDFELKRETMHTRFAEGRDRVRACFDELIELGYVSQHKNFRQGKFDGIDYIVHFSPKKPFTENPYTENQEMDLNEGKPFTEKPRTENPHPEKPRTDFQDDIIKRDNEIEILKKEILEKNNIINNQGEKLEILKAQIIEKEKATPVAATPPVIELGPYDERRLPERWRLLKSKLQQSFQCTETVEKSFRTYKIQGGTVQDVIRAFLIKELAFEGSEYHYKTDKEGLTHFLNWIPYYFQNQQKPQTNGTKNQRSYQGPGLTPTAHPPIQGKRNTKF